MSLEQTLERTNELLAQIVTMLQTGVAAQAELGTPEKTTRTRKTKDADAQAPAPAPAPAASDKHTLGPVEGDPVGTRYFVIEKHNTVYAQKPGDPDCNLPGAVIVSAEEYLAKKQQYAALSQKVLSTQAAPTTAPAPGPAPSTPAASTAPSQTSEGAPAAEVPFAKVVEVMTTLSKSDKPGHGREGVLGVLKKYLPGDDRPTVTKLQPLGINADIIKHVESLLTPAAAEDFDPLA